MKMDMSTENFEQRDRVVTTFIQAMFNPWQLCVANKKILPRVRHVKAMLYSQGIKTKKNIKPRRK